MTAELSAYDDRTRKSNIRRGLVDVYYDVDAYGSVPVPYPNSLGYMSLLNYQVKLLRDPAEALKRRLILLYLVPILLEVAYHMLKQILLWLRLALCFTTRPLSPLALTVIYWNVEKAFDQ